jgi:MoaA/NifB/PqqE/SkfB family radical SAM enzyme
MTLKKIIKAFIPYGILWLYNRKIKKLIKAILPRKIKIKMYLDALRKTSHERLMPRKLLRFEVNITDHCNLNCIGCEHFSPLAKEKYIDISDYEKDCARLGKLLNWEMENIHLMGGEPLLHPQINRIIEITRKYFVKGVIEIVTNGILLMKQDRAFWKTCNENNVIISVTQYPIGLKYDEIERTAKSQNVELRYYHFGKKTMQKRPFDLEGKQDIKENIKICHMANNCVQLRDGKLYTCVEIAYIGIFNEYFNKGLEVTEKDYIDIYKAQNKEEVFNFLNKPVPFCRYCDIMGIEQEIEWKKSKKEITEWT